jgi:hypothetical protein
MPSAVDRLCAWARQTFSSLFQFRRTGDAAKEPERAPDSLIYRLRRWPKLPSASMNTDIYRTLSVMSSRPVNRRWILNNSRLQVHQVDRLLQRLVEQDAVHVTDSARYGPDTRPA